MPIDQLKVLIDGISRPLEVMTDGAERFGEAIQRLRPEAVFMPQPLSLPRASAVAMEAVSMLAAGACTDPGAVSPVYLRKSQPEMARDVQTAGAGGVQEQGA